MRKTFFAAAVAAILGAGAFLSGSGANAMTLTAPAGMKVATEGVTTAEQVRYVCYRVRRGGVWRRVCSWRPNAYVAPRAYYGYRPNYYRPYYRPYGYYGWGRPGVYFRF